MISNSSLSNFSFFSLACIEGHLDFVESLVKRLMVSDASSVFP